MTFKDLKLTEVIMRSLEEGGYETPTLIQEQAIPIIMKKKDLLGCAQTGTGKTAAFALPIIEGLLSRPIKDDKKPIRTLVLTPTRELAIQIRDTFREFEKYTDLKCSVIFGGVNQRSQVEVLKKGVDILVATPGRLLDLINQKYVKLNLLEYLVLDEADTMLDMGFLHDVKKIVAHTPSSRQTLLFSATMPKSIEELASTFLKDPSIVKVAAVSSTVDMIDQSLYYIDKENKPKLLVEFLKSNDVKSALIFTRTKHGANKLGDLLKKDNIYAGVIHGNKSQNARVEVLKQLKEGKIKILIATDIAARGIDIHELSHVFNYEMPEQAETYVHRIGRTGRAGLCGCAISFCNIDEKPLVSDIERLIKISIPVVNDHLYPMINYTLTPKKTSQGRGSRSSTSRGDFSKKGTRSDSSRGDFSKKGTRSDSSRGEFQKQGSRKNTMNTGKKTISYAKRGK